METVAVVLIITGGVGLVVGLGGMLSWEDWRVPWAWAFTFAFSIVAMFAGMIMLPNSEDPATERDRIFDEAYAQCMDDYESGRLTEYTGPGAASDLTYVCEGEAWRAVERFWNERS